MPTTLPVVIPDFDSLNSGFQQYLKQQQEYSDFVFDGSGLSTLLDVHAFNSHYLAFFLNQVANESFLYTGVKRSSVVSRAKGLSYIPRTASSAGAIIQLEFIKNNASNPFTPITVNAPSVLANYLNRFLIFSTTEPVVIKEVNGKYISPSFNIYEGKRFTYKQTIDESVLTRGFVIPNVGVDINHLTMTVTENNITTSYQRYDNIVDIKGDTKGFFYYENADGRLVLEFGDGVLGYKPPLNSIMTINYLVCSGSDANGIDTFTLSNADVDDGVIVIRVVQASTGGDDIESIESVKRMAPLMYTSQDRAVIDKDYVAILKSKYPNVDDVIAFGGETLDPPKYGKVIIVVKPKSNLFLTSYDKQNIINFIKKYNVMTITPIVLEPDYIYINANINVIYDYTKLTGTKSDLNNTILNAVSTFETTYLSGFDRDFRYSTFLRSIDFSDKSVVANISKISLEKKLTPPVNTRTFIDTSFNNPIVPGTISTSTFTYNGRPNCFIDDSQVGTLSIYQYTNSVKGNIANNIGSIDYENGKLTIPSITISSLDNINNVNTQTNEKYLSIYATPVDYDVLINKTNIGKFNKVNISLNLE